MIEITVLRDGRQQLHAIGSEHAFEIRSGGMVRILSDGMILLPEPQKSLIFDEVQSFTQVAFAPAIEIERVFVGEGQGVFIILADNERLYVRHRAN